MNENTELIKAAVLGADCEAFLNTELGKYLLEKANTELEQAQAQLLTVSATNPIEILKLQSQGLRAISFKTWLLQAISDGQYAEGELRDG